MNCAPQRAAAMKAARAVLTVTTTLAVLGQVAATTAAEPTGVRRFALVVGSNDGGVDRVRLHFAVTDAHTFADVLSQLGGVLPADGVVLEDPSRSRLLATLDRLGERMAAARKDHRRTELVLYYSGHSDEYGLLLGPERITYKDLRAGIAAARADVKIAILDSCASGALLREKGGHRVAPFLIDDASQVSGHAFLTSSSADEAAQESDRLGGSFFTHHLVSGLRGAADVSGDGRVTLNEAYQFAFQETLARTEHTRSGPQHPNYDIDLSGSGDVVITDLTQMSSILVLDAPLGGRFFVRDSKDRLVAEVQKAASGRAVELGLEAGVYRIAFTEGGTIWVVVTSVPSGRRVVLQRNMFSSDGLVVANRERGAVQLDAGWPPDEVPADDMLPDDLPPDYPGVIVDGPPRPVGPLDGVPVRLSLLPGLSLMGSGDGQLVDGFAFGLIGDRVTAVRGMQLTSAFGVVDEFLRGVQLAGAVNVSGGWVDGAQLAGAVNVADGFVRGAQVAGALNVAGQDVLGLQLAGGVNVADGYVDGFQVAGGVNLANDWVRGGQISSGLNVAGPVDGAQITGGVNIAEDVTGVQLGVINIGRHVTGAQIGVINIADTVDGVSFGVIPIVSNGYNHLEVWGDSSIYYNLGARLGTPYLHFLLSVGTTGFDSGSKKCVMRLGGGLGTHVDVGPLYVDFDLTGHGLAGKGCNWDMYADDEVLAQARLTIGLPLTDGLAIFIGGAANGEFALKDYDLPEPLLVDTGTTADPHWSAHFFPSFFLGLRVF